MKRTLLALRIAIALAPFAVASVHAQSPATPDADATTDAASTDDSPASAGTDPPRGNKAALLPEVVVNAMPLKQTTDEVITPVIVLSGAALDDAKANTIGETVSKEIGVQTTAFGAGVGRPVIRGLDGPRVSVLSNGLSSGDVSTVSQDHAVAIEPFLADQIEILKGPSTLLYGSGAIGGVVNIVDGRIPQSIPDNGLSGRVELRGNTVADERTGMARVDAGSGNFAFHFDGVYRDADDYKIPGSTLDNSFVKTKSGAVGASYIGDRGYIGFSVSRYLDNYGNPAEPGENGDGAVTLQLEQTRYDVKGELTQPLPGFDALRFSVGHIDYKHTEFEGAETGTIFLNKGNEGRVELVQSQLAGWDGAFGLQFLDRQFQAIGEEAFIPKTTTQGYGLFGIQQRQFGAFKLELGARVDKQSSDPQDGEKVDYTPISFSLGGSYRLSDQWHLTANFDRAQRAPAEEELFANGPHIATEAFEIGDPNLAKETANQFEIGLHFHSDWVEAKVAAYANRFNDYIYLVDTGETKDDLAVRQWTQADAKFHGFEAEAKLKLAENDSGRYDLRLWGDTVNARLADGGYLPRIAPARAGVDLGWKSDAWRASVGVAHYFTQDKVPEFETDTAGFTLVNAHLSYALGVENRLNWEVFADASNLTNQTARLATSYIKDLAPLPGRSLAFGVRAFF
jgi:iron complex outermembrane receptor protein